MKCQLHASAPERDCSMPTSKFDFNYQPLANQIHTHWVSWRFPADYYKKGGNKPTFMRDEVYAFFIRWIYNTGEKSKSYHIPGRPVDDIGGGYTLPTGVCCKAILICFSFDRSITEVGIFFLLISFIAILLKVLFGAIPIRTGIPVHCLTKDLI